MRSMQQVQVAGIGSVVTVQTREPQPKPGWVQIRTLLAGICGSDTHAVAGHHPLLPPPYCPGHEAVGVVSKVGAGVSEGLVGQRVILKPNVACGKCINCADGLSNACQQLAWIGCDPSGELPGAMAECFVAPESNVYLAPDDVTDTQAVLVECLATPIHAARIAGDLSGARVLVLGAGTIGLFSVIAARWAGAKTVVATDLSAYKRERAQRHGADIAIDGQSPDVAEAVRSACGGRVDAVFDCVATANSMTQALTVVRRAATILIVGVPAASFKMPMPYVQDWELRVQGCANYNEDDFAAAVALGSRIPAAEIIAKRCDFDCSAAAFAEAAVHTSGKVVIGPAGTAQHEGEKGYE